MKRLIVAAASALVFNGNIVWAQTPAAGSDPGNMTRFSKGIKARYDNIKRDVVEAAEAVPEAEYTFKPTPQVRSFGEIIGHIADTQNYFCAVAAGSNPEYADTLEKTAKSKTDLVKGLKDSVAKCDDVYAKTDAANALSVVKAGKGDALRGMVLLDNVSHDNEHYGNIVTYMRLKGHVPPSTARTQKSSSGE
jgi:uncharacterized damage-inducible protein DinB